MGPDKTVTVAGPFRGTVLVETSLDQVNWTQALVFTLPGSLPWTAQALYVRVSRAGVPVIAPGLPLVNVGGILPVP